MGGPLGNARRLDDRGTKECDARHLRAIELLVDGATAREVAAEVGVAPDTVSHWKRMPFFKKEWEKQVYAKAESPERVSAVIDALFAKAAEGDTKAADLYLRFTDKFVPKEIRVQEASARELSDEELAKELEEAAGGLRMVR